MLFAGVFICVCLFGYLAQTTGLCMVRAVHEWKMGNKEFLLAILFSGILAWVAALFSYYVDISINVQTYSMSAWFLLGGLIFGLGAAFNKGCGISTLGRLARGDSKMIATVVGWLVGWTILAQWSPEMDLMKSPVPSKISNLLLMVSSLGIIVWVSFGDKKRKRLWFGMMAIGLLAGFIYLYQPNWSPNTLLKQLSSSLADDKLKSWPSWEQYSLFVAVLIGMFSAAWQKQKFAFVTSNIKYWLGSLAAGVLMGMGASLAMGGNSAQLLLVLPSLSPAGLGAIAGMLLGIWSGLYLRKHVEMIFN